MAAKGILTCNTPTLETGDFDCNKTCCVFSPQARASVVYSLMLIKRWRYLMQHISNAWTSYIMGFFYTHCFGIELNGGTKFTLTRI